MWKSQIHISNLQLTRCSNDIFSCGNTVDTENESMTVVSHVEAGKHPWKAARSNKIEHNKPLLRGFGDY